MTTNQNDVARSSSLASMTQWNRRPIISKKVSFLKGQRRYFEKEVVAIWSFDENIRWGILV